MNTATDLQDPIMEARGSHSPAPPGGSWGVPRSDGVYIPSSEFWFWPGASSQEEPPQLTPFYVEEQRLYSELPLDGGAPPPGWWSSSPYLWGWAPPPSEGNSFQPLVSTTSFFGSEPRSVTTGEGWNKDGAVTWKPLLPAQLPHSSPTRMDQNHGLRSGRDDFKLSCELKVVAWRSQQNHIICRKQRCDPEVPKPDALLPPTTPPDPVHEDRWYGAALF